MSQLAKFRENQGSLVKLGDALEILEKIGAERAMFEIGKLKYLSHKSALSPEEAAARHYGYRGFISFMDDLRALADTAAADQIEDAFEAEIEAEMEELGFTNKEKNNGRK